MPSLPTTPFFIVGNPRSGTTLLRFMLSSHPQLYIPAESGFLPFLRLPPQARLTLPQVAETLQRIGRLNREWEGMVDDVAAFYRSLPEPTLPCLLDALYRQKIRPHGARRWGDKTPSYVRHIPALHRIFPTAQFIHLIRDGRDAAISAKRKWGQRFRYMDMYYLLANWVRNVEAGRRAGEWLGPGHYLEVRYEQLVARPRQVLREVCTFLGERFHPGMLDHTALARQQIGPRGHVEVRSPLSTASVGRWKSQMSPFEQKLADQIAGSTLTALGYEQAERGPFSPAEWGKFAGMAVKFWVVDSLREAGFRLGLLTLNRGKRRR